MKEVCTRLALGSFAVVASILPLCGAASAHDWYPYSCCHDRDCRPVPPEAVKLTPRGWQIQTTGETIPFDKAQYSPDGRFHICSYGGVPEAKTICLFTPGAGS